MYTENNENYNEYDGENENTTSSRRGIIIKIIIIAVCLIILIWLIIALKNKNSNNNDVAYDSSIHENNVQKVRLAAEKYFFLEDNMPKNNEVKTVTVETLINKGLLTEVVDANKKVCNDLKSISTLEEEKESFALRVKLSCSTDEKEEVFYYKKDNYACLNCNGVTNMDGTNKSDNNNNKENSEPIDNNETDYSCTEWSTWSREKVNDASLQERTRTLVMGVKRGGTKEVEEYSNWSEYSKTPLNPMNGLEVETKMETEKVWSDTKTSTNYVTESETVKLISTSYAGGGSYTYCPNGYKEQDNKCVSEIKERGDLTYLEYNSGNYYIYNKPCDAFNTEKTSNGQYQMVYKNCLYSSIKDKVSGYSSGYTVYNYQELEEVQTVYYRYRTKTKKTEQEDDVYTDKLYEEDKLPEGFVKINGSEIVEYSYKYAVCEK